VPPQIPPCTNAAERDPYFNPLDLDVLRNPYPSYAALRTHQPVYWHSGMGLWLVSRYTDCVSVLVNHRSFTSDYRRAGEAEHPEVVSVQTLDPPEQVPVRRLLLSAIKSLDTRSLEAAARSRALNLIKAAADRGIVDFVTEVAAPYAFSAAADILGIEVRRGEYARDAARISASSAPALQPEFIQPGLDARQHISSVLAQVYAAGPESGVLGYVFRNPATVGVPRDLLLNSLRVLLLAIINSASRFLTLGLKSLVQEPSNLGRFATAMSPDLAVHELVRYDGPFQAQEKTCIAPEKIGDTAIAPGERVVVLFASANRDEAQFPQPDELMFSRHPNLHLGFGRGVHACLGTHQALVLSRAMLRVVAHEFPGTRLHGEFLMDDNPTIRGMRSMPVRFV